MLPKDCVAEPALTFSNITMSLDSTHIWSRGSSMRVLYGSSKAASSIDNIQCYHRMHKSYLNSLNGGGLVVPGDCIVL